MAKIVLMMGQSNSFGYAANSSIDASFKQTFTSIKAWNGSAFASLDYAVNNNQYPAPLTDCSGCEYALCKGVQELYNETIYFIKYAVPDTYLGVNYSASVNWNTATRNSYFDASRRTITAAMESLWTAGHRSFEIFIVWEQGEGDSKKTLDSNNYKANLKQLISGFARAFGTCAEVNFISVLLSTDLFQTDIKNTITNATNANPIVITCGAAHNISNGDLVTIVGVTGNTAANVTASPITVVDATRFSVAVAGNGAFTGCTQGWSPFVYVSTINTAMTEAAAESLNTSTISANGHTKDSGGVHRTAGGCKTLGEAIVTLITNL